MQRKSFFRGPLCSVYVILVCLTVAHRADGQQSTWVHERFAIGDFKLVAGAQAADIFVSANDFKVVQIAARNLSEDLERVSGKKPAVVSGASRITPHAVIIGTAGKSPFIDSLIASGKLPAADLRGK